MRCAIFAALIVVLGVFIQLASAGAFSARHVQPRLRHPGHHATAAHITHKSVGAADAANALIRRAARLEAGQPDFEEEGVTINSVKEFIDMCLHDDQNAAFKNQISGNMYNALQATSELMQVSSKIVDVVTSPIATTAGVLNASPQFNKIRDAMTTSMEEVVDEVLNENVKRVAEAAARHISSATSSVTTAVTNMRGDDASVTSEKLAAVVEAVINPVALLDVVIENALEVAKEQFLKNVAETAEAEFAAKSAACGFLADSLNTASSAFSRVHEAAIKAADESSLSVILSTVGNGFKAAGDFLGVAIDGVAVFFTSAVESVRETANSVSNRILNHFG